MRKIMIKCIVSIFIISLTGCATVVVRTFPADAPEGIYPATRSDVTGTIHYWQNKLTLFWSDAISGNPNVAEKLYFTLFAAIDLPISLVTDTICLPVDLYSKNKTKKLQQKKSGDAVPSPQI